ncbi:MAG TPA: TonB family protein [Acidobacteriota bacterium]|nr:TonB family protein [Acidobacteriota bacterium]
MSRTLLATLFALLPLAAFGKQLKEVPVSLQPVRTPSSLPAEYQSLPAGRRLPSVWNFFARPSYPRELERIGVEGEVKVEFVVNAHGYVVYAMILEATDQRFATSVLEALKWIRPDEKAERDPALPARFVMPVGFSIGAISDVRDQKLVAKITTLPVVSAPLSFSKPYDLNPRYPGAAAAKLAIKAGMSSMDVYDTLGRPCVTVFQPDGSAKLGFGPDMIEPEFVVSLENDRVTKTSIERPKRPAPQQKS